MTEPAAQGDVAATAAEAAASPRPPLIVLEPLERFLDERGLGEGRLTARPIGDGHSNVTYELRRGPARFVLRRPPRPPLPPSAHDVVREARLMSALRPAGVRVPETFAVCTDADVIGAPFHVMEHIDGAVIGERLPPALDAPAAHAAIARELVDGLAELHAVDPSSADLAGFGRPQGYLERQLRRFSSLWESQRTREVPDLDRITRWLHDHVPATRATTVVHGDYRLGNVMFDTAKPQLLSILDWEMSTLGDPLADLGYLCVTWAQPGDEENPITVLSAVTRGGGFPSPAELREHYATRTGRDVSDLRFYEVLALWKAVVFFESSFRRFREGTTDDPYFARLEAGVPQLAREAIRRTGATSA